MLPTSVNKSTCLSPTEAAGEFPSLESTLCTDSYSVYVRSTPVLPQWHAKDPGHSAESAVGRLHLNTHTPSTRRSRSGLTMLSKYNVATYKGNELTRNSSRNTRLQSSQLAEPLRTDPGPKSGISARELISTKKKKERKNRKRKKENSAGRE